MDRHKSLTFILMPLILVLLSFNIGLANENDNDLDSFPEEDRLRIEASREFARIHEDEINELQELIDNIPHRDYPELDMDDFPDINADTEADIRRLKEMGNVPLIVKN